MKNLRKIKFSKKIIISIIIIFFACFWILYVFLNKYVNETYLKNIYTYKEVPQKEVWLILWAWARNGKLSIIFKDRLRIAALAYKENKIKKVIISWDNSRVDYDELTPAKLFLNDLWVKKNDIFLDYAWFDTYQSLYRANYIFSAKKINIITQEYHLKRALYICDELWLECDWIKADRQEYMYMKKYIFRETLANLKAYYNTFLWNKKPQFLWEKIDLNLDSNFYKDEL